jgi:hypothetical protein
VRRIDPHGAAAAAIAHDAELVGIAALLFGPGHRGVEVGQQLGIQLGVDDRHQLGDFGDLGQILALAEIVVGGDREGAELAEPAGHVLDVLVQPEDLHGDQDDRRVRHIGRAGEINRHFTT